MAKINQAAEKRARNEEYALKYKKVEEDDPRKKTKKNPLYGSWCRTPTHPPNCSCNY